MRNTRYSLPLYLIAFALLFGSTESAFAYLDPGTGSVILQLAIAGLVTVAASVRLFWSQVKECAGRIVRPRTRRPPPQEDANDVQWR